MDKIIDSIYSIRITNLVALFDILVVIAIIIVFFLLRSFVSKLIIGVVYKIRRKDEDVKKDTMFYPLKLFF